jgi:hypothetical protein
VYVWDIVVTEIDILNDIVELTESECEVERMMDRDAESVGVSVAVDKCDGECVIVRDRWVV